MNETYNMKNGEKTALEAAKKSCWIIKPHARLLLSRASSSFLQALKRLSTLQ